MPIVFEYRSLVDIRQSAAMVCAKGEHIACAAPLRQRVIGPASQVVTQSEAGLATPSSDKSLADFQKEVLGVFARFLHDIWLAPMFQSDFLQYHFDGILGLVSSLDQSPRRSAKVGPLLGLGAAGPACASHECSRNLPPPGGRKRLSRLHQATWEPGISTDNSNRPTPRRHCLGPRSKERPIFRQPL